MWYVHVNQHVIRSNIHAEVSEPPIAVKCGKHGKSAMAFDVVLPAGSRVVAGRDGAALLACGARVVIECSEAPTIVS